MKIPRPFSRLRLLSFEAILNDLGELLTKIFYFIDPSFFNFFDHIFKDQGTFLFIKDALFHFLNTYFPFILGAFYIYFSCYIKDKTQDKINISLALFYFLLKHFIKIKALRSTPLYYQSSRPLIKLLSKIKVTTPPQTPHLHTHLHTHLQKSRKPLYQNKI